jgi:hypothetical protein
MSDKKQIERGSAHVYMILVDGNISVYHGDDMSTLLYEVKNVEEGSWNKIWEAIRNIKSVD